MNGLELAADWRISPSWRVQLAQTWNDVTHASNPGGEAATWIPQSISSLRLSWTPVNSINLDAWLRHTDDRPSTTTLTSLKRNAFSSFDLRLAWRPRKDLELSLTGQNLNDGACEAYSGLENVHSTENLIPTCQPRSLIGQFRLDF
ncbi:hypothetical protein CCP4SC76_8220001 [Gammaproteobacteria bacterium]